MMHSSCLLFLYFALGVAAFPGVDKRVKEWSFLKRGGSPLRVKVTVEITPAETKEIAVECIYDDDCPEDRECKRNSCEDPCLIDTVCGPNKDCYVSNHSASCFCNRDYIGDPRPGCNDDDVNNYFDVTDGRFYVKGFHYTNFTSARDECIRKGMRLATFRNKSDYDQLKALLRTDGKDYLYYKQFIGAIYDNEHQQFEWESTGRPLTYNSWADGEPTPLGPEGQREDCVAIEKIRDYNMNNVACSDNAGFICESIGRQLTFQSGEQPDKITDPNEQTVDLDDIVKESTTPPTADDIDEITKMVDNSTAPQTDVHEITDVINTYY